MARLGSPRRCHANATCVSEIASALGSPTQSRSLRIDEARRPDVDAHPRIGERATGSGTEAGWSRNEQAAAATVDERIAAELNAGNVAYEHRFGHVFLICATGRAATEILAALNARLGHDPELERTVVRAELQAIVRLRLAKALG